LVNFESETEARRNVISGIDSVARKLGHTRAVCRRAYVHPAVIEAYMDRSLEDALKGNVAKTFLRLKADESAVVALLKRSMVRKGSKGKVTSGRI
jgi:DNA topoisomerase-1